MSRKRIALALTPLCGLLLLTISDPALAAGGAQTLGAANAGDGLAELLQGWARVLIPAVVALVGIPAIARHDFGMAISIFIVALLLGSFAFMSADDFKSVVSPVVDSLTAK